MSLIEFIPFCVAAGVGTLGSQWLGHLLRVSEAVPVVPITGTVLLLLSWLTKTSPRRLLLPFALLALVTFLSIGLAHFLSLRNSVFLTPFSAAIVLVLVQISFRLRNLQPSRVAKNE